MGLVAHGKWFPDFGEFLKMSFTFSITLLAWVFFRAENLPHAFEFLSGIFSSSFFSFPVFPGMKKALVTILLVAFFMVIEWIGRENQYAIEKFGLSWSRPVRWSFYYFLGLLVLNFAGKQSEFIYFQF
jgi:hypothetical protein